MIVVIDYGQAIIRGEIPDGILLFDDDVPFVFDDDFYLILEDEQP